MTEQKSEIKVCLADMRHSPNDALHELIELVRSVEIAVSREKCRMKGFSFFNIPNQEDNPDGEIATITFFIENPDDVERNLDVSVYQYRGVFRPFNMDRRVSYLPK